MLLIGAAWISCHLAFLNFVFLLCFPSLPHTSLPLSSLPLYLPLRLPFSPLSPSPFFSLSYLPFRVFSGSSYFV